MMNKEVSNSNNTSNIINANNLNNNENINKIKKTSPLYKQLKLLGQGSFGKAFLVENTSDKVSFFLLKI